jgi:hypothetical protein
MATNGFEDLSEASLTRLRSASRQCGDSAAERKNALLHLLAFCERRQFAWEPHNGATHIVIAAGDWVIDAWPTKRGEVKWIRRGVGINRGETLREMVEALNARVSAAAPEGDGVPVAVKTFESAREAF